MERLTYLGQKQAGSGALRGCEISRSGRRLPCGLRWVRLCMLENGVHFL